MMRRPSYAASTLSKARDKVDLSAPIDSLSERSPKTTLENVGSAIQEGQFKHMLVTSRREPPGGRAWEQFKSVTPSSISSQHIKGFVAAYVEDHTQRDSVLKRLSSLVEREAKPNPLFLRFAVEQAMIGPIESTDTNDLVVRYVEASRKDDVSPDDFLRAVSLTAVEAIRDNISFPGELEIEYLRGVLQSHADRFPFMSEDGSDEVNPARLIDAMTHSGILTRNKANRKLQFFYDPVAEHLAQSKEAKVRAFEKKLWPLDLSTWVRW